MDVDLNRVDLNLLVALDALLAERNVTRAAARLSVGQPAMSATLGRLRRLFDDPLLVRSGRGLVPTPFADSLAEPLHRALNEIERVLSGRENFEPAQAVRTFTLMATDYVTLVFLPALLTRLAREAPGVTLNLLPVTTSAISRLRDAEIDLLIHPQEGTPNLAAFTRVGLFRDRYVAVVSADSVDPDVRELPLDELLTRPYLATTIAERPSFVDQQIAALGIRVRREAVAGAMLAPFLVAGTPYVALLPEHLADYAARVTPVRILEPPVSLQAMTESMMWSPRNTHDPGHRWLRRTVQSVVHDFDLVNGDWGVGAG